MSFLPLVVEKHFFTKVVVEANPDFHPEKLEGQEIQLHTKVQGGHRSDNLRRWRLTLTVSTETSEEKQLPYKLNLECVGFFSVSPEVDEKKIPFLVHANGAAILYSSAREFLLMITGRGPWGGFYLPTTDFLQMPKPEEEEPPMSEPLHEVRQKNPQNTRLPASSAHQAKGTAKVKTKLPQGKGKK